MSQSLKLLQLLGNVEIPANPESFRPSAYFQTRVRTGNPPEIAGAYLFWDHEIRFRVWFGKLVELPFPGVQLSFFSLQEQALDREVITALGGEGLTITQFYVVYWLIKNQPDVLWRDHSNIFYVRDYKGQLRVVSVSTQGCGYYLSCYETNCEELNGECHRIFSPRVP